MTAAPQAEPGRAPDDPEEPTSDWAFRAAGDERKRRIAVYQAYEQHKAEAGKLYQLTFAWGDDKRAMPTDFIAHAVFAGVQPNATQDLRGKRLATVNGYSISFTGRQLTQVHADVFMGVCHLMRGMTEGSRLTVHARAFLKSIGRSTGKTDRDGFRQLLDDLIATAVRITGPGGKQSYAGSLLARAADAEIDGENVFVLDVNRELLKQFERGFGAVNWEQRKKLMRKPLALWLQLRFSKYGTRPVALHELHAIYGGVSTLRGFRRQVKMALVELDKAGVGSWLLDDDDVIRPAAILPPSAAVPAAQQALPGMASQPLVSARAMQRFQKLYARPDAERCVADWQAWLAKSGNTADKPDAAWLGFAKTWVQSN
jgi:hypothetical protein